MTSKWTDETWAVVGEWLNRMAATVPDPSGDGPWLPTMDAVRDALESVEVAWVRVQPEGTATPGSVLE
jgi:hypothetical protein